jgi:hypothetical protein
MRILDPVSRPGQAGRDTTHGGSPLGTLTTPRLKVTTTCEPRCTMGHAFGSAEAWPIVRRNTNEKGIR